MLGNASLFTAPNSVTLKINAMRILFLLFLCTAVWAQPKTELTPEGFTTVAFKRSDADSKKLIEISKAWADSYNKIKYDVYNVSDEGLTIDALRENAFFYKNRGEVFKYTVFYSLQVYFGTDQTKLMFSIKEIFADKTPIESNITDYFTPEGEMKEGFEDVKKSIEETANKIIKSYWSAISR